MRRSRGSKISNAQTFQEMPQGKSNSGPDPKRESRVRLLPVDPYLIHAYWEIFDEDLKRARSQLGSPGAQVKPVIRFYDITHILFDGKNAHGFFDVEIDLAAGNWYVHLWSPEKSYCADLGLKTPEGRFLMLVRSNVTHTPPAWPSIREEERYMRVSPRPELSTASSTYLSVLSREEFAIASRQQLGEKPSEGQENRAEKMRKEQLFTEWAQGKARTRGEPGRPEGKGALPKEKERNPAVPSIGRGTRSFDLTKLSEQYFCGGNSSWRSRSEEE